MKTALEPRKRPVQARSAASVDAILKATVQVLLRVGKERLTTTRVAERAGVSVGTLYQYFPNKSALLQAALRQHLESMAEATERVCRDYAGHSLAEMATALVHGFLEAKMQDAKTSVALYSVSSDVDGASIVHQLGGRSVDAIAAMLQTAREPLGKDPQLAAQVVMSALAGVSRRLVESDDPEKHLGAMREELTAMVSAYLERCAESQ
ncbi:MAG TPA: TetR/AcrR family transcriptional regulator [Alloacidobacterium sp.]|nr:TetR/AcrR family transcriptional regulator [Alloacidobacterium sp.]